MDSKQEINEMLVSYEEFFKIGVETLEMVGVPTRMPKSLSRFCFVLT
jgi:hypothetical protein